MYRHYERQLPDIYIYMRKNIKLEFFLLCSPGDYTRLSPLNGSASWHAWVKKRVKAVSHSREQIAEFAQKTIQDVQLSQRDRAAGCIVLARSGRLELLRQYFTDIIGLSSTTVA